jgi:hypothetical protein
LACGRFFDVELFHIDGFKSLEIFGYYRPWYYYQIHMINCCISGGIGYGISNPVGDDRKLNV